MKPWPWPADTHLERVKRLARAYRDALAELHADTEALDAWAVEHGEGWIVDTGLVDYGEDDLLTLDEVARWAGVRLNTVYQWHWRDGLSYVSTADGERVRKGELVRWERDRRRARLQRRRGDHPPGG